SPVSLSSATLTWTAADDNVGVAAYRVFANGLPVVQTDGSAQSATLLGLDPSVLYTFQVQAVDAAGNASPDGPAATLRLDTQPPSWPQGSTVTATSVGAVAILVWTGAIDNAAVIAYDVLEDGQVVATVNADTLSVSVPLPSAASTLFQIQAVD